MSPSSGSGTAQGAGCPLAPGSRPPALLSVPLRAMLSPQVPAAAASLRAGRSWTSLDFGGRGREGAARARECFPGGRELGRSGADRGRCALVAGAARAGACGRRTQERASRGCLALASPSFAPRAAGPPSGCRWARAGCVPNSGMRAGKGDRRTRLQRGSGACGAGRRPRLSPHPRSSSTVGGECGGDSGRRHLPDIANSPDFLSPGRHSQRRL